MYGVKAGGYRLFCDSHPRGVDRCDMRAGIGAVREICQTAGDMRAERAECGSMGLGRSRGGEGDMRADGARRDMGDTDIKKTPYREI